MKTILASLLVLAYLALMTSGYSSSGSSNYFFDYDDDEETPKNLTSTSQVHELKVVLVNPNRYVPRLVADDLSKYNFDPETSFDVLVKNFKKINKQLFTKLYAENTDYAGAMECSESSKSSRFDICLKKGVKYRNPTGACNNEFIPWWGDWKTPFKRIFFPDYYKTIFPRDKTVDDNWLPNPKTIASKVHTIRDKKSRKFTKILATFAQFVMHDVVHSTPTKGKDDQVIKCDECWGPNDDCMSIPLSDRWDEEKCMSMIRLMDITKKFKCAELSHREAQNDVNSWVDLSVVYGNTVGEEKELRSHKRGNLRTSKHNYLPSKCPAHAHALLKKDNVCFQAGDDRVNQYPALSAMHTLWMREHNRIANKLAKINPHWDDEKLFQEAKRILAAMYQNIVYSEFLSYIVGPHLHEIFKLDHESKGKFFTGYDDWIFPNAAIEFALSAARFGHNMVESTFSLRDTKSFRRTTSWRIEDIMYRPKMLIDKLAETLNDMIVSRSYIAGPHITNELNEKLVVDHGPHNKFKPFSLGAYNIQRGRDGGIPSYCYYRKLARIKFTEKIDELTWIPRFLQKRLKEHYDNACDIDLYTGSTCEKQVPDGFLGPTSAYIAARAFRDWKYADRFYYENSGKHSPHPFTIKQLDAIRQVRFSSVICQSSGLSKSTVKVFEVPSKSNLIKSCRHMFQLNLNLFKETPPKGSKPPKHPPVIRDWFEQVKG